MSEERQHTITELEELLSENYEIQILPDGTITTHDRPVEKPELLTFRANIPFSY